MPRASLVLSGIVDRDGRGMGVIADPLERLDHFLILELEGTASNRDGVGAKVAVTVAGRTRIAERFGGGTYASASDRRLHFGLGASRTVDLVEITWPPGR